MGKCLVLGANGFIGSHLVDSLIAEGHTVRCFDRYGSDSKLSFEAHERVEVFKGDFLNRDDLVHAIEGQEYVFHFISTTTPLTAENDPLIDIETNIKMSVRLFELCHQAGVKQVIFASTGGAIYGTDSDQPIPEKTTPEPISPYAIGKLTIEHYLHYFHRKFGLSSLVYRISNPYGERQSLSSKQGVIPIFLSKIYHDEPITILGNGSMVRDYIYVKDVARMIALSFLDAKKRIYNIGSGTGSSVNEIVEVVKRTVGTEVKCQYSPVPPTFVNKVVLDTSLFRNEFGLVPEVELKEGIAKTWEYIKSYES
jgi:UDP-glucose 4-epimerase